MARSVTTYKVRTGNSLPDVNSGSIENKVIFYLFGSETQEVINCGDNEVVKTTDMCMFGGDYYSAQYSAYPGKVDGKLLFSANLAKRPILSATYKTGGGSSNGLDAEGSF